MSFKVGDKVRVKGAKPVGEITNIYSDGKWRAQFGERTLLQEEAEALGIELELVEPALPEEPPLGSVFKFRGSVPFWRTTDGRYFAVGSGLEYPWKYITDRWGTYFTVLREEKEVIREVLSVLKGTGWSDNSYRLIAKHFGVSVDDH